MKLRKILLFSIVAITLAVVSFSFVVQDVGSVKQLFFPMVTASVDSSDSMEEWERISIN